MNKNLIVGLIAGGLVLGGLGFALNGDDDSNPAPAVTTTTQAPAPTTTTTPAPAPTTTTTTTVDVDALTQELEDRCYGPIWDGMKDLSDNATALAEIYSVTRTPESLATVREALRVMQESVDTCRGIVSPGMTGAMQDLTNATSDLVDLYVS